MNSLLIFNYKFLPHFSDISFIICRQHRAFSIPCRFHLHIHRIVLCDVIRNKFEIGTVHIFVRLHLPNVSFISDIPFHTKSASVCDNFVHADILQDTLNLRVATLQRPDSRPTFLREFKFIPGQRLDAGECVLFVGGVG